MADNAFIQLVHNRFKFGLFLFTNLPSAFFSGVRIKMMDENVCSVTVPYKWFSKNPFRSTYFACLAMAAELSTGALAMAHVYKKKPPVSMLVVKMEAAYFKKAIGITAFTCKDGALFAKAIASAIASGQSETVIAHSQGINDAGETVAEFTVTWSFKAKNSKENKN